MEQTLSPRCFCCCCLQWNISSWEAGRCHCQMSALMKKQCSRVVSGPIVHFSFLPSNAGRRSGRAVAEISEELHMTSRAGTKTCTCASGTLEGAIRKSMPLSSIRACLAPVPDHLWYQLVPLCKSDLNDCNVFSQTWTLASQERGCLLLLPLLSLPMGLPLLAAFQLPPPPHTEFLPSAGLSFALPTAWRCLKTCAPFFPASQTALRYGCGSPPSQEIRSGVQAVFGKAADFKEREWKQFGAGSFRRS